MPRPAPRLAAAALAVLLYAACASTRVQRQAREFTDAYFTLLRDGQLERTLEMMAPEFYERTPREEWLASRRLVDETLGPIREFHMEKWTMELLPNGSFVTFEYAVSYARGSSRDTVTVVRPVHEERFLVFGHHLRSPELDAARGSTAGRMSRDKTEPGTAFVR